MPKPRGGLCDGHHTPVDSDAAPVAGSRGFPLPRGDVAAVPSGEPAEHHHRLRVWL